MSIDILIVLTCLTVLAGMSLFANGRLRDHARLPMQWSLSGTVNWSAPRPLALAITPLLAAVSLVGLAVLLRGSADASWALMVAALSFVGAHLLHLALLLRRAQP
ncbi:hypothetical protein [Ancylobacter sp.]|uniref:hypothetical protein n=1 Tax=Ancylobacter sp. TaxID=1872567 RepID=UPI003D0A58AC